MVEGTHAVLKSGIRRGLVAMLTSLAALASVLVVSAPAGAIEPGNHNKTVVSDKPASWTPHVLDGYVQAFAEIGNRVVVGGNFQKIRSASDPTPIAKPYIFVFEKSTGTITSFNANLNGEVTSLVPSGDGHTVYVGGGFSSVNGQTIRSLVKLDIDTGQRVTGFNPPAFNGRIHDVHLRGDRLIVSGRFTTVAGQPQTVLAAVNATTGQLDPTVKVNFAEPRRDGALSILSSDVTPDGSKLVAIGNFTKVNGLGRYQIAQVDLTTNPPTVANWSTNQYGDGCSRSFQSYMRDVEFSADGSFFVVATTGAYSSAFLCDTAARWETHVSGSDLMPTWVNYTGGDTLLSVAVGDSAVYLGGHQRWANNPYAGDRVGAGAVSRPGISAVDARSGATLSWNPGRDRGVGVFGFLLSDSGLWIGSDTDRISNYTYKGRMAFMPVAGGKKMPTEYIGSLPGQTVSLKLTTAGFSRKDQVVTRSFTGTSVASESTVDSSTNWRDIRGAFMVDGVLYTGWSDKTFKRQTYDGTSFGPQSNVPLALIADNSASQNRFSTEDLSTITGMFYDDASGQIFFTRSGRNVLSRRSFSPESNIVGAQRLDSPAGAGGVVWSNVRTMFLADGFLYTGDSSGNLYRRAWDSVNGLPTGPSILVSGPTKDGRDWSAQDTFVFAPAGWVAPNSPPIAVATSNCTGPSCAFDGSASSDPDGSIVSYSWNFGDGTTPGSGAIANHVYASSGTYTVELTVTDDQGAAVSTQIEVQVEVPNQVPTASFTSSCNGLTCRFDGSASSDPDGTITSHGWTFGDGTDGNGETVAHTYASAGKYEVKLTVTDDEGATNSRTTQVNVIDPNETPSVTFDSATAAETNWTQLDLPLSDASNGSQLLLFATVNRDDVTVTGPDGWSLVDSVSNSTISSQSYLWTRTATPADQGAVATIRVSAVSKISGQLLSYNGVESISAHAVEADTVSHADRTTPTVLASAPGSRLVSYWADKSSATTQWSVPAGVDLRLQAAGTGNGRITAAVADSGPIAPGPAGGITAIANSVTRRAVTWSVLLAPTSGPRNSPPIAAFTSSCTGLECRFDASTSFDPDGTISAYEWKFGDGTFGTGKTVTHSYPDSGNYGVELTVTDNDALQSSTSTMVSVNPVTSAPTLRAVSEFNNNVIDASPVIPSATRPGDTLVLITSVNSNDTVISGPAGWTLLGGENNRVTGMQSFAWTKTASPTDAGSLATIAGTTYSKISAQLLVYENAAGVTANAFAFDAVNHADRTTPGVVVSKSGSVVISYWADKNGSPTGWTLPGGVQLRSASVGSGGGLITAAIADTGSLAPGPTGGFTASAAVATRRAVTWSIVIGAL